MGKILRNLQAYRLTIIVIVLLLAIQAYCDLSLPQYTSDIIDVGIQNSGVAHVVPEKLTEKDFVEATGFMNDEEKRIWSSIYDKVGDGYTLNVTEGEEWDKLDEQLMNALVLAYQGEQMSRAELVRMMEQADTPIEDRLAALGEETLKSMGIAYAVECHRAAGIDVEAQQMDYLWATGRRMLLVAGVMLLAAIGVAYLASRVGAGVGRDLRQQVFHKVMRFSNAEMDRFSTASLITRSTNDVQQIQMVSTLLLRMLLYSPILAIGGIYKAWQTGANMGYIIALAVLLILGFVLLLVSIAMPKFKAMQKLVDAMNLVSREILTGIQVIRAFGREKTEEERFDVANKNLMGTQLFTNRVMSLMMPGMTLIMNGLVVIITWTAAHRIDEGSLQVGMMTAFITYSMLIVMSFLMMTVMSIMIPRAAVAAERIDEILQTEPSIKEISRPRSIRESKGVVEFKNVSFRYPGAEEAALRNLDFVAEPGKITAIIGSTGAGKSTLVNLIPRFFDVTDGEILLDGINIKALSLEELRRCIGFVPQKGILFSGTIASNLRFGKESATDKEIALAAEVAQAAEFIAEKEEQYDSRIAQGGSNVSGGQKQRLSIARAIAKAPQIYIFDDSFSALDMKTDAKLRRALARHTEKATKIIVAQRISTILHADRILVLDDGEIVGQGTHSELMSTCEVYQGIAASQLSTKELAASVKQPQMKREVKGEVSDYA